MWRVPTILALWTSVLTGLPAPAGVEAMASAYRRATNEAGLVMVFKPREQNPSSLPSVLAPFILQGVDSTNAHQLATTADQFGVPLPGEGATAPVVYTDQKPWPWGGHTYTQVWYLWLYAPPKDQPPAPAATGPLPCQGVRLTLNRSGHPVVWEPLATGHHWQEVYAAGSLEHAAQQTFPTRLPRRQFVLEPPLAQAPDLIVPLILDDSPVVFGPMIYLNGKDRSLHAVICRCMPALARAIADTRAFELRPWPADAPSRLRQRPDAQAILQLLEAFEKQPPFARLRLPPAF